MGTVLGLAGLVAFIVCVIALAAAITAAVVKLSPAERPRNPEPPPA